MTTNPPPKAASRFSTGAMVAMALLTFAFCSVMIDVVYPKKAITPTPIAAEATRVPIATPEPPTATPTITLTPKPMATDKPTATPKTTNPASTLEGVMAKNMCQKFVSEKLKAPASAEFGNYQNDYIPLAKVKEVGADTIKEIKNPDGIWRITGSVDAQNGFGAMIRSNYTCIVDHDLQANSWHGLLVEVK